MRVAACAVVAVSVWLATDAQRTSEQLRARLDELHRETGPAAMTARELDQYRRIWREISVPGSASQPLVLLHDDGGRLEYLSDLRGGEPENLLIVRCWVLAEDGGVVEQMNLLLPQRKLTGVSLADAAKLGGMPVRYNLSTDEDWVSIGLNVGDELPGPVGVGGRVRLGQDASEIGRFRLEGKDLRVFVQAVPLATSVG